MVRFPLVVCAMFACLGSEPETPEPDPVDEVAPEPEPVAATSGFAIGTFSLWRKPTDDRKIPNPDGEGTISNWIANVYRGEPVDLTDEDGDWTQVRTSEGTEGWIKTERLVTVEGARVATIVSESKMFQRPDFLALDTDSKLEPGSVLIVLEDKDKFSHVDYPRSLYSSRQTWALAEELIFDATEIEAAKLISKVLQLREKGDDGAGSMEELVRDQFAGSQLIGLLDVEEEVVEEEAPEEAPEEAAPPPE